METERERERGREGKTSSIAGRRIVLYSWFG